MTGDSKRRRLALKSLKRKDTIGIILLGDEKVGKTALVNRWLNDDFIDKYKATVEDFHDKEKIHLGRSVNVTVVDIAGSGQFPAMEELYIKKSDVIILTYEIGNQKSIDNLKWYYTNVKKYLNGNKEVVYAIVGTKFDKYEKTGYYEDNDIAKTIFGDLIKDRPREYLTSSKTNHNVNEVFEGVIECVISKMFPSDSRMKQITDERDGNEKEGKNCCVLM